jgi:glycerophosphoryl diester phosphodiesterase
MIEVVCHRGANEYAPENTYPAAEKCIEWGADYVEIDINTSRDGVPYIFHGPALEHTTDGMGMFYDMTSSIIDTLDCGSWFSPDFKGERIPKLDTFLRWVKGKAKVYFDVKRADHQQLIDLVYETGLEKECFFWSAHHEWSAELKQRAPELPVKFNTRNIADLKRVHQEYNTDIVEIGLNNMTDEFKKTCQDLGIKIMIYHQQKEPESFKEVINWDVEMVNLNHADVFIKVAQEMGVR